MLFTGSMRDNLDPFHEHSDAAVWAALRRAHLALVVEASPAGLDMILSEGGSPLSAGQKQLAALARALLKHSKACRLLSLGLRNRLTCCRLDQNSLCGDKAPLLGNCL